MAKKKTTTTTEPTHGGARPGAGRPKKKDAKIATTVGFTPEVMEFLQTTGNRSVWIEELIRKSSHFRQWKKQSK